MTQIKNKDFVEIEYTGKIKEDNSIFDTTDEKIAKENDIFNKDIAYGPVVICIGEGQIPDGLEKELEGKEPGKYTIELPPEMAFGKKNPKLIQLIQTSKFLKQRVHPVPGLQVNIDGMLGLIKTVSGGRTLVDFNHPLAGKELAYSIKINKIVTEDKEKIKSYLKLVLNLKDPNVELVVNEARIILKNDIPQEIKESLDKKIKELISSIKKIEFVIQNKKDDVTPQKE